MLLKGKKTSLKEDKVVLNCINNGLFYSLKTKESDLL